MSLPAEWPQESLLFRTNKGKQLVSDLFGCSVCHQFANFAKEELFAKTPRFPSAFWAISLVLAKCLLSLERSFETLRRVCTMLIPINRPNDINQRQLITIAESKKAKLKNLKMQMMPFKV